MKLDFSNRKKIVIKIGSSLLVKDGELRQKWLKSLVKDIAELVKKDFQITIVSSGAVALGKGVLNSIDGKLSLAEKQAAAAVGQIKLMGFYNDFFKIMNFEVAQILMTAADCNSRNRYLNSKNTIDTLLENNVIPIINENDTLAVDEIKIGDNDRLAARVAQMISADLLILFTDIDGLYDKNPRISKNAKLIAKVTKITKEIEDVAGGAGSDVGTGGMATKVMAAKMLTKSGCDTIITSGIAENALKKLCEGKSNFTIFNSRKKVAKSRKNWLSGFFNIKSGVVVNKCAVEVLLSKKVSLLPVGVELVKGDFKKGDIIFVNDEKGNRIASGITNYSASDAKKIIGKRSIEVKKVLGKSAKKELVHIDNLVVIN
jgi:glutamate 5-kinase